MTSCSPPDDYQVQNINSYFRKTYKNNFVDRSDNSPREGYSVEVENMLRNEMCNADTSPISDCSCGVETEREIASILHKKCPVISLAQQQLQQLVDSENLVCHTANLRSIHRFLAVCRELLSSNKYQYVLPTMIGIGFGWGLLLGSASCGTTSGRFDSAVMYCIDNFFVSDTSGNGQEKHIF